MMRFESTMSRSVQWVGLTTLAIAVIALAIFMRHDTPLIGANWLGGFLVVFLLVCYLRSPTGYAIVDGSLVIRRVLGSKRYDLHGSAVHDDPEAFRGLVRLFGNGGFFAFHGRFYSRRLGSVRVYSRNKDHGVVVMLASGRKLVLSPDDSQGFIEAAVLAGASADASTTTRSAGRQFPVGDGGERRPR